MVNTENPTCVPPVPVFHKQIIRTNCRYKLPSSYMLLNLTKNALFFNDFSLYLNIANHRCVERKKKPTKFLPISSNLSLLPPSPCSTSSLKSSCDVNYDSKYNIELLYSGSLSIHFRIPLIYNQ